MTHLELTYVVTTTDPLTHRLFGIMAVTLKMTNDKLCDRALIRSIQANCLMYIYMSWDTNKLLNIHDAWLRVGVGKISIQYLSIYLIWETSYSCILNNW